MRPCLKDANKPGVVSMLVIPGRLELRLRLRQEDHSQEDHCKFKANLRGFHGVKVNLSGIRRPCLKKQQAKLTYLMVFLKCIGVSESLFSYIYLVNLFFSCGIFAASPLLLFCLILESITSALLQLWAIGMDNFCKNKLDILCDLQMCDYRVNINRAFRGLVPNLLDPAHSSAW